MKMITSMSSVLIVLGRNILDKLTEERKQELIVLSGELFSELIWKLSDLSYEEYYYFFENIASRCSFQMVDILKKINNNKKN